MSGGLPSADDGQVAFTGSGQGGQYGVYLGSGVGLTRVADTTTPVPDDTRNFETFASVVLDGTNLAFVGNGRNRPGVYLHDLATGNLTRVADTNTPVPGRTESFRLFDDHGRGIDLDGGKVAFIADSPNTSGVYLFDSSSHAISTIADWRMPIPGGDGSLFRTNFNAVSIDDGRFALQYGGDLLQTQSPTIPPYGVYAKFDGLLEKVIAGGDIFENQIVIQAEIGPDSLDGNQIAIQVWHTGGEGIYMATLIPEPGTLALLIAAFCFVALIACRRSNPGCESHHRTRAFRSASARRTYSGMQSGKQA